MSNAQPTIGVVEYANPRAGQPADSPVVFEQHDDGISYTIPPEGVRGSVLSLTLLGLPILGLFLLWFLEMSYERGSDTIALTIVFAVFAAPFASIWLLVYRGGGRR